MSKMVGQTSPKSSLNGSTLEGSKTGRKKRKKKIVYQQMHEEKSIDVGGAVGTGWGNNQSDEDGSFDSYDEVKENKDLE
jgi:hypothetical protein